MAAVTVSRSGDRLIAIKQVPAEHARDIEREAETLQRIDHPGVVRFVDVVETPDQSRALHTEFVSSDTWATRPITDPACRAAAVAAVAEVVADLHDMGFAHCRINPSHVLHGDGDRPVLCGFRRAAEATPENRRSDLVAIADLCHDPEMSRGPLAGKLSDLTDAARAGRLDLRELARRLAMVPDKRSTASEPGRTAADSRSRRNNRQDRSRPRRRSLVALAVVLCGSAAVLAAGIRYLRQPASTPVTITAGASSPGADAGAGAADPMSSVADAAPDANPTGAAATDPTPFPSSMAPGGTANAPGPMSTPSPMYPGGTANAAGPTPTPSTGNPAGGTASAPGQTPSPSPMIPGAPIPVLVAGSSPLTGNPDRGPGSASSGLLPASAATNPEAGPPLESAALQPGVILQHAGNRYGVGRLGDFVETGDWDCDGEPTPAIVRPSTGDVVLFDGWPAAGQAISMPVRWQVDAPTGAEAVAHGSCHLLRVYTSAGSRLLDPMEGQ